MGKRKKVIKKPVKIYSSCDAHAQWEKENDK